jgi:hypothetical protein
MSTTQQEAQDMQAAIGMARTVVNGTMPVVQYPGALRPIAEALLTRTQRPVTLQDAGAISTLLRTVEGNQKVARLMDGNIITGTARNFVNNPQDAYFVIGDQDIRDAYLHVTTTMGFEVFWPVAELMADVASGYFVGDYDPGRFGKDKIAEEIAALVSAADIPGHNPATVGHVAQEIASAIVDRMEARK